MDMAGTAGDFDAFFRGPRGEIEERVFVADDFCLNFSEQILSHGLAYTFDSSSERTLWNAASAS